MHYVFDVWMENNYKRNPWVRFADDGVVHCWSREEALSIVKALDERLKDCKLEMHPEKTKIVYCRHDGNNKEETQANEKFDFLGYTFMKRHIKCKNGKFMNSFSPAVSRKAKESFRQKVRDVREKYTMGTIEMFAEEVNPIVRGWFNYFSRFFKSEARKALDYVNRTLLRWAKKRFRRIKHSNVRAIKYLSRVAKDYPNLFYHWSKGFTPTYRG
jgi:RNA-directed DNA polymerase